MNDGSQGIEDFSKQNLFVEKSHQDDAEPLSASDDSQEYLMNRMTPKN